MSERDALQRLKNGELTWIALSLTPPAGFCLQGASQDAEINEKNADFCTPKSCVFFFYRVHVTEGIFKEDR